MRSIPWRYSPSQTNEDSSYWSTLYSASVRGSATFATPSFGMARVVGSTAKTSRFVVISYAFFFSLLFYFQDVRSCCVAAHMLRALPLQNLFAAQATA